MRESEREQGGSGEGDVDWWPGVKGETEGGEREIEHRR
jgi:hypothetical protein